MEHNVSRTVIQKDPNMSSKLSTYTAWFKRARSLLTKYDPITMIDNEIELTIADDWERSVFHVYYDMIEDQD
jgi:hypothetical protein